MKGGAWYENTVFSVGLSGLEADEVSDQHLLAQGFTSQRFLYF